MSTYTDLNEELGKGKHKYKERKDIAWPLAVHVGEQHYGRLPGDGAGAAALTMPEQS